ncbi:C40 family peptidase [Peribacillus sp. SCS-155]|uniref:C40 family peptidase n=1 Tax=Peribacillus sedimenti TaxID=3115297 RepID=UPI00390639EA
MKKRLICFFILGMLFSFAFPVNHTEAASPDQVISVGKKYIGVRYSYGGTTPNGFDCSGFIKYTFKRAAGISLPRTSAQMATRGKTVTKSQLKKGDLVFFRTSKAHNGVSHAGIYIGNNKFIHASSSKGVSIASLNDSYWKPKFIRGQRL